MMELPCNMDGTDLRHDTMAELTLQADDFNFMNYTRIDNLDTTCPAKEVDEYGADLNPTPKTWRLKLAPGAGILQGVHRHWQYTLVVSVRRKIGQTSLRGTEHGSRRTTLVSMRAVQLKCTLLRHNRT